MSGSQIGAPQERTRTVTELLKAWSAGDESAREAVLERVYRELRTLAAAQLRKERRGHTLQPTALVHEAFLRLVDQRAKWLNRAHFFGIASQQMRRILVDSARRQRSMKRGVGATFVPLDAEDLPDHRRGVDVTRLDDALTALARLDPRQARIVELRYFGGREIDEIARVLDVSPATVKRDWTMARAWLFGKLSA